MTFTRRIASIYVKELVDILRDRRTLMAMLVVPIVLYPVLMVFFANAAGDQTSQIKQEPAVIGALKDDDLRRLQDLIRQDYVALCRQQGLPKPAHDLPLDKQPHLPQGSLAID